MGTTLAAMTMADRTAVIDIFNYYVEHSFAAYPESKVSYDFYDAFLNMCQGYPNATVKNDTGEIVGFGMLRPYNAIPAFVKTAEIAYFIKPGHTGNGLGKALLEYLLDECRKKGITSILASISSLNEGSIRFHARHGFVECGRFRGIGQKHGRTFDVVYYQRVL